jgi:hypothetical protein
MGPRTMTNSEMQDRTTTDVIGKAAGRDQHHSVGSCDVADQTFARVTNERFVDIKVDRQERPETAYVCRNRTWEAPLTSAEALRERCST